MVWVNAIIQGILVGGLYALFATGLSIAFGVMRFVNLAHGDLAIVAAFMTLSLVQSTDISPWAALLIVLPGAFLVGVALQRLIFNRVVGVDPAYQIVATFGLGIVIQNLLEQKYSPDAQGLDGGSIEAKGFKINDQISIGWQPLIQLLTAVALLGGLSLLINRTKTGRAFRATSDDLEAARLMGIDAKRVYAVAMGLALASAALAGVFLGTGQFTPYDGPVSLIYAFEAVIIGGLGSLWGTLAGGITLGVAQAIGAQIDPQYSLLAGHIVFLAVLATKPTGMFGKVEAR